MLVQLQDGVRRFQFVGELDTEGARKRMTEDIINIYRQRRWIHGTNEGRLLPQ